MLSPTQCDHVANIRSLIRFQGPSLCSRKTARPAVNLNRKEVGPVSKFVKRLVQAGLLGLVLGLSVQPNASLQLSGYQSQLTSEPGGGSGGGGGG